MEKSSDVSLLSRDELVTLYQRLQRKLQDVTEQRDELANDVEMLSMSAGSATFDTSSVLQERVLNAERELSRLRKDHRVVCTERDELAEDHVALKESKRISDKSCREATLRITRLEKDLNYYQAQAAKAMQDRDRAQSDAEAMREHSEMLESTLTRRDAELKAERSECADLARRVAQQMEEIGALRREAEIAARLPAVEAQLADTQSDLVSMTRAKDDALQDGAQLREEIAELNSRLEKAQADSAEEREASAHAKEELEQRLHQDREDAEIKLKEVQQQLSRAETLAETRARELAAAKDSYSKLEGTLASSREDTRAAQAEVQSCRDTIRDLEAKLQQEASSKTELLMENADLKEQLRDASTADRDVDDDAWHSWPWKPTYNRSSAKPKAPPGEGRSSSNHGGPHSLAAT